MKQGSFLVISALILLNFTGCSKDDESSPRKETEKPQILVQIQKFFAKKSRPVQRVLDEEGHAISGAQVLIGMSEGRPFQNNLIKVDANGEFEAPEGWIGLQAITIDKPGYVRATFLGQSPEGQNFVLRRSFNHSNHELRGENPGVEVTPGDGYAYFSMVMPVLQKADLLHFNLGMVMSSQLDTIAVLGQSVKLPSNLALPSQRQSYFFPFTLNKPIFRMNIESPGTRKILALSGRFPFKPVVDKVRAGVPFYSLTNYMQILNGGVKEVEISGPTTTADIPVNQFSNGESRAIASGSIGDGEILTGVSLVNKGGDLIPSDVKLLQANSQTLLKVRTGFDMEILSILKRRSEMEPGPGEDRLSAVIIPFEEGITPVHLPLLENPKLKSNHTIRIQKPELPSDLESIATYASLQKLTVEARSGQELQNSKQIWEVYSSEWLEVIEVPSWPGEVKEAKNQRWSVALLAGPEKPEVDLGPGLMQAVTHVTNSSVEF